MTLSGLPKTQWRNHQECLSPSPHLWTHWPVERSQVFHQTGCLMGLQQCMHQRRRSMESSIQDQMWIIWTYHHVFWHVQLPCNLPSHDGQHLQRREGPRMGYHLHGRHIHIYQGTSGQHLQHEKNTATTMGQWPLPETRKVIFLANEGGIPRTHHRRRQDWHGSDQAQRDRQLAWTNNS